MAYGRKDYAGGASATTLSSGVNSSDTTLSIAAYAGWPTGANGPFAVVIDAGTANEEKVLCTSRSNGTITVNQRGYDGTTAAAHLSGASIKHCLTAVDFDEANYWVAELATAASAANDIIIADGNDSLSKISKGSNSTVLAVDSGGTLGYTTVTSAMIADGTIATGDIANAAVTADKIASAVAGNGLAGGAGTALSVNVDASTIEIVTDTLQVKDAGITAAKIAAAVAGNGLGGGAGTALSVNVDGSTLEISSDSVRVKDSGITFAKLAAALQALLVPTGVIQAYGATTAPTGWLLCDGSAVSRSTYADLFTILGTSFGTGNGSTTFNVPDLRGRAPIGKDDLGGTAASRITTGTAGFNGASLGAAGGDQRLHQHSHANTLTDPTHAHQVYVGGSGTGFNSAVGFGDGGSTATTGTDYKSTGITITNANSGSGSSQNVQPSIVVAYIIKT